MGKIIAFTNQKGGVGKTTSAVNVAASLGILGKKVLLVDLDPQGSATSGVGVEKKSLAYSIRDLFRAFLSGEGEERTREIVNGCILTTKFENLSLMPAVITLSDTEFQLYKADNSAFILKNALHMISDRFDYLIIDCPPSLGMLTVNALTACDGVIIPMQCEFYSLEGLSQLIDSLHRCKKQYNPELQLAGILITMYNGRLNLTLQVMDELKRFYADKLFKTNVLRNVRLSEAPSYGCPIIYYDANSKGAEAYRAVAKELAERV